MIPGSANCSLSVIVPASLIVWQPLSAIPPDVCNIVRILYSKQLQWMRCRRGERLLFYLLDMKNSGNLNLILLGYCWKFYHYKQNKLTLTIFSARETSYSFTSIYTLSKPLFWDPTHSICIEIIYMNMKYWCLLSYL